MSAFSLALFVTFRSHQQVEVLRGAMHRCAGYAAQRSNLLSFTSERLKQLQLVCREAQRCMEDQREAAPVRVPPLASTTTDFLMRNLGCALHSVPTQAAANQNARAGAALWTTLRRRKLPLSPSLWACIWLLRWTSSCSAST
jgi:hypothetical protein